MSDAHQLSKTATLEIGGQTLTFTKINLSIMSEFVNGMQRRVMQQCLDLLGPEVTTSDKVQILQKLQADALSSNDFDLLKTADGILYMLWLCARPHHPELTVSGLGDLIPLTDFEGLSSFVVGQLLGAPVEAASGAEKKGMKLRATPK